MVTMTTTKEVTSAARVVHLATDHLIHPLLSALTGSDVTLTGRKLDGTPYAGRHLTNVSFVPVGGSVHVVGMDPDSHGVRRFDLGRASLMETDEGPLDGEAIKEVLSGVHHGPSFSSEGGAG
jgi:hypothetical protein